MGQLRRAVMDPKTDASRLPFPDKDYKHRTDKQRVQAELAVAGQRFCSEARDACLYLGMFSVLHHHPMDERYKPDGSEILIHRTCAITVPPLMPSPTLMPLWLQISHIS